MTKFTIPEKKSEKQKFKFRKIRNKKIGKKI